MNKSILTQKKIDRLDKISKKCGLELHMPPLPLDRFKHCPFFVFKDEFPSKLIKGLARSKFIYGITRGLNKKEKNYIVIKG
jgi:hypothetical protein